MPKNDYNAPPRHTAARERPKTSTGAYERGRFVISLDFELHWGVRDKLSVSAYRDNLLGEREVVPELLRLFAEYGIHATWATVGFMFFRSRSELLRSVPQNRPNYTHRELSPYDSLATIGESERDDPFHFAPSLIHQITAVADQEIATHTFSHYYCLERGRDEESFRADLATALEVARDQNGIDIRTIVFPRNQVDLDCLRVCSDLGIEAYRGNPTSWLYTARSGDDESTARRGFRLLDAYLPISGTNAHYPADQVEGLPHNVPASRYLRPYSSVLRAFEPLRLRRILDDLTLAAERKQLYHLWWHPHDFGARPQQNLTVLARILERFAALRESHGMESLNMLEAAEATPDPS
jgi:peptidoglycan/xylan/chitin deacetylase (PgdA/CDA1 family)